MGKTKMNKKTKLGLIIALILLVAVITSPAFSQKNNDQKEITIQTRDFTLKNLKGEEITLTDYSGKIIILDFMGTNCPACAEEMSHLKQIKQQYGDQVVILSIATESQQKLIKFKQNHDAIWQFLIDQDYKVFSQNNVEYIPKIMIFNQQGDLIYQGEGETTAQTMHQKIQNN
ncbi:hypothetical protein C9439_00585 [archaeon SCG-AAA382B04]|nr:hypothetical protein C9439_00585 [archaeon SCG-AAA382B04]